MAAVHECVKYPCTESNYKASLKHRLKAHVAEVHEGVRYPCTECYYEARQKRNLKGHMAANHTYQTIRLKLPHLILNGKCFDLHE